MAIFKITVGGIEITASNAADVADLVRAMSGTEPENHEKRIMRRKINDDQPKNEGSALSRHSDNAISFLDAIATHDEVDSQTMQEILKVDDPKGMGPKTRWINTLIEESGFDLDSVYTTKRDRNGRTWSAGPKIKEAISALRKRYEL